MKKLIALAALAGLAACGWAEWPPPGQAGRSPASPSRAQPRIVVDAGAVVTVQAGETLFGLARRHKVPPRAIIEANGLKPPYQLLVGQTLAIPSGTEHDVKPGETIHTVAGRYGVDPYELARVNGLRPPYLLKTGEKLMVPGRPALAARVPAAPPSASVAPAPSAPPKEETTAQPIPLPPSAPPSIPPAVRPEGGASIDARVTPKGVPSRDDSPARPADPPVDVAIGGGGKLAWPVRGRVISGYGVKEKGLRNDGINIAAPKGAPIRAAEAGTVAYAGNELRGFGNLLLIRHASGLVTAYAHADQILVKRGETVSRGQIVARVGSTGGVTSPQLHFEVRHGRRPVDPERYLEKS
jgi:murein DD-endopeptidase MepM/ murein hydrolase activator NlpD